MSRLGQGGGGRAAGTGAGDGNGGAVRKVVKVVKAGSRPGDSKQPVPAGGARKDYSRNNDRNNDRGSRNYGSDDGLSYNPFAALLKNRK